MWPLHYMDRLHVEIQKENSEFSLEQYGFSLFTH